MAFDCPDCGEVLKATAKSCPCGWKLRELKRSPVVVSSDHGRCQWENGGRRCRYIGAHSPSTYGGGPWFCIGHLRCQDAIDGLRIVDESEANMPPGMDYTTENLVRLARENFLRRPLPVAPVSDRKLSAYTVGKPGRHKDTKAWAKRILERQKAGDPVPIIALTAAREVLGVVVESKEREAA